MKKFDIRINKNEFIPKTKPMIYLNYNKNDEVFVIPIKDLIVCENMEYSCGNFYDLFPNIEMIINIITDNFYMDYECEKIAVESAKQSNVRIVSICFENSKNNNSNRVEFGEIIYFADTGEKIEDYCCAPLSLTFN